MGSRFIASNESEFCQEYKEIIPQAQDTDTDLYTGVFGPIRLWKNDYAKGHKLVENKEEKIFMEDSMDAQALLADQKHYEMTYHGDIKDGAVLLGQSIGIIKDISSVQDILDTIMNGAEQAINRIKDMLQ